jgi:hypothetical protein
MSRQIRFVLAALLAVSGLVFGTAASGASGVPAKSDLTSVYPVMWEGQVWLGRESPLTTQMPNHNYWLATPQTVFTDDRGRLHLVARQCGLNWCGAGIATTKRDYGYGTYRFVLDTPMKKLDPVAVVGMFTYNKDVKPSQQESDVELSRWGSPSPTAPNAQWAVQPWTWPGHLVKFTVPRSAVMTYEFTWRPRSVIFRARLGAKPGGTIVNSWKSTAALPGTPVPGTEVHINLWFQGGQAPYSRTNQEVIFRSFTYTPLG